ncbi:MAG: cation transporter [Bacteriovoracaceae bacterium]|nr:cation transporter [Bacteriovoracaceae bacterium]
MRAGRSIGKSSFASNGKQERYVLAKRATFISIGLNITLSVAKIMAGIIGNSAAMLADGIHSSSDLVSDGVVFLAMKAGAKKADKEHPYGYGKYETLASLFIALMLIAVAIGIVISVIKSLGGGSFLRPTPIALAAAFISLITKELLFQYTIRLGKRINAKALIANAWHQRSDAISSIAALIGIGGAMLGYPVMDPLAAVAVALILGKVAISLLKDSVYELADASHSINSEVRAQIEKSVKENCKVIAAHGLAQRGMGPDILVDVHVEVDPFLSVSEGHQIADRIRSHLIEGVQRVTEVMVHVDIEDDQNSNIIQCASRNRWKKMVTDIIKDYHTIDGLIELTPHYVYGGITLDLVVSIKMKSSHESARVEAKSLSSMLVEMNSEVKQVRVRSALN